MDLYNTRNVNKKCFLQGLRNGIPIGLGYLAVSFSLGIAAKNAGLNAVQSFLTSLLCNASAGEYAGFTLIAASASYIEVAVMMLIVNARYLLMSCAMSQRMNPDTKLHHRLLMSFHVTDELFAIAIARSGYLNPFYSYGAVLSAAPCWAAGTALGTNEEKTSSLPVMCRSFTATALPIKTRAAARLTVCSLPSLSRLHEKIDE